MLTLKIPFAGDEIEMLGELIRLTPARTKSQVLQLATSFLLTEVLPVYDAGGYVEITGPAGETIPFSWGLTKGRPAAEPPNGQLVEGKEPKYEELKIKNEYINNLRQYAPGQSEAFDIWLVRYAFSVFYTVIIHIHDGWICRVSVGGNISSVQMNEYYRPKANPDLPISEVRSDAVFLLPLSRPGGA